MSNRIVPTTYRTIIDDVILNMRAEFEEYGVSEDVLNLLQDKWETKVIASRVAEFESSHPPQAQAQAPYQHAPPQPMHPPHSGTQPYSLPPPSSHYVKTEPVDRPYVSLNSHPPPMTQYMLPPINGHLNGANSTSRQSVLVLPRGAPPTSAISSPAPSSPQNGPTSRPVASGGASGGRIPQLDGPSYAQRAQAPPRASTSSTNIPQLDGPSSSASSSDPGSPSQNASPSKSPMQGTGNEEINSDLDDSDSDAEDEEDPTAGGGADVDIVFCTYDKVARVKNKWKCVLKDGMIHVNGKDYLFAKCNGEFEW